MTSMDDIVHNLRGDLLNKGWVVDRNEWQGIRDYRPQTKVREIPDVHFKVPVPSFQSLWADNVKPNLPWAEDHFQERISGEPLNPGKEYKNWPWYDQGVEEHKPRGKFSHTYMERFWPKIQENEEEGGFYRVGIRFEYGDLAGLVELLQERPFTRQAYLPIWFPEDLTAAWLGERVPCTLGYHFQMLPHEDVNSLHMTYFMRSCDYYRYLRDDVYMAGRLLQWIVDKLPNCEPGNLTMNIANLHIFNAETERLETEHKSETQERLNRAFQ